MNLPVSLPSTQLRARLTPVQRGMFYASRLAPGSGVNVEQLLMRLREPLEPAAWREAWRRLVKRHPSLRTIFTQDAEGELVQEVVEACEPAWHCVDWRTLNQTTRQEQLTRYLAEDRQRGFELTRAPLCRVALFRLEDDAWQSVWTYHHLLLDGRSLAPLVRELFAHVEAIEAGTRLVLPEVPWLGGLIEGIDPGTSDEARRFWTDQLLDVEPGELPHPHHAPHGEPLNHAHAEITRHWDHTRAQRIAAAAEQAGVTPHTLVQAAWGLTLGLHTGRLDTVFASVRACRHGLPAGTERSPGMAINTVPFRVRWSPGDTVCQLWQSLRAQQIATRAHETTPLGEIQSWVGLRGTEQLAPTMLMFDQGSLADTLRTPGGAWNEREFQLLEKSEFPLALIVYGGESWTLQLEYDVEVCTPEAVLGWFDTFERFLLAMVDAPDASLEALPTMSDQQRRALLHFTPAAPLEPCEGLHSPIRRQATDRPTQPALRHDDTTIRYAELSEAADQLAAGLRERGVVPGMIVGLSLPRSPALVAASVAILRSGAASMPLDPDYPLTRLQQMIDDARPAVILTTSENAANFTRWESLLWRIDALSAGDGRSLEVVNEPPTEPESPAVILYTSGSTGTPKGVVLPHRALIHHNRGIRALFDLRPSDRVAQMSTINFDVSLEELFGTLNAGATLVIPTSDDVGSLNRLLAFIERERITVLNLTAQYWQELVYHCRDEGRRFPESVRLVIVGGERTRGGTYRAWLEVGGDTIRWINAYGPTETAPLATSFEPDPTGAELAGDPPIGRPLAGVRAYVLDEAGRLLPPGVAGELYLGGASVALGYLDRPELTAARFLPDPFAEPAGSPRMYRTGDRVRLNDKGEFEYLDRLDHQVKLRGLRIELGEIESAVQEHPAVAAAVVTTQTAGHGHEQLVAYVVLHASADSDLAAVTAHVRDRLPEFMVPQSWQVLPRLPLLPNGKVDRRGLQQPTVVRSAAKCGRGERSALLTRLAQAWQEVLGLESIDDDDDFFLLGGDSLRSMRLTSKIEALIGRGVPLALLVEQRTFRAYATAVERTTDARGLPILLRTGDRRQSLFLAPSLCGDVFLYRHVIDELRTDRAVFGLQLRGLDGHSEPDATVEACAAHAIEQMRRVQPRGPYAVGGYSSGGIIAFEIARQLTLLGEEIEWLGLIDSGIPTQIEHSLRISPLLWGWRLIANARTLFQRLGSDPGKLWHRARQLLARRWNQPTGVSCSSEPDDASDLRAHFDDDISFFSAERRAFIRRHLHALDHYAPLPYGGSAEVLRSAHLSWSTGLDPALGWNHLVFGGVRVTQLQGHHGELVKAGHSRGLAEAIGATLPVHGRRPREE